MSQDHTFTLADLFVVRCRHSPEHADNHRPKPLAVGVFTSPQSIAAFPIATAIVATAARAGRTIGGLGFDSVLAPLLAAAAVAATIFAITASDYSARPTTWRDWLIAAGVCAVNSLMLFAAAIGIEKF